LRQRAGVGIHLHVHLPGIYALTYTYGDSASDSHAYALHGEMFTDTAAASYSGTAPVVRALHLTNR